MGYLSFTTDELTEGKAIKSTTLHKIRNNLEWVRSAYQYNISQIPNRDFEIVTDKVPDSWEVATYENGWGGITSSTSYNGRHCLMLIHEGGASNMAWNIISDYIPISTVQSGYIATALYSVHWGDNISAGLCITYYDASFNELATESDYTTVRSTVPTLYSSTFGLAVPTSARWYKVRVGISATNTVAGTVFFDNPYQLNHAP